MRENAIVVALGQTGSGKTTKIHEYADRARRAIIADPEGKWTSDDPVVRSGPELLAYLEAVHAEDPANPFRVIYRDSAARMELAAPAAAFAYRNLTLVIDEIVWLCSGRRVPEYLLRVIQVGRDRRINLLVTTRDPIEIPQLLLTQASVRLYFHVEAVEGIEGLTRRFGKGLLAELHALPPHQFRIFGDAATLAYIGREGLALPGRRSVSSRRSTTRQR